MAEVSDIGYHLTPLAPEDSWMLALTFDTCMCNVDIEHPMDGHARMDECTEPVRAVVYHSAPFEG